MSESIVYRLLKAQDLINNSAYIVSKAANQFCTKTTWSNGMWQTD